MTTIAVTVEVEVNDAAWASLYGAGDANDRADAQRPRSLVADVEDYVLRSISESAAAQDGAFVSVELAADVEMVQQPHDPSNP
jgi:RNA-splicing ligase RtcB